MKLPVWQIQDAVKAFLHPIRFFYAVSRLGKLSCLAGLLLLCFFVIQMPVALAEARICGGHFELVGQMHFEPNIFALNAVKLKNGKVLIFQYGRHYELYNPETRLFEDIPAALFPHDDAIVLKDGKVLFPDATCAIFKHTSKHPFAKYPPLTTERVWQCEHSQPELYDPESNTFRLTKGKMQVPRSGVSTSLLPDGKVFLVGGLRIPPESEPDTSSISSEIYDPKTEIFHLAAEYKRTWVSHREPQEMVFTLENGKVLLITQSGDIEIYDPILDVFKVVNKLPFDFIRGLIRFQDERFLVWGNGNDYEIYDPNKNIFIPFSGNAKRLNEGNETLLNSGQFLITGNKQNRKDIFGDEHRINLPDVAIFNPVTGKTLQLRNKMKINRGAHMTMLLDDGTVLIFGSISDNFNDFNQAELFVPQECK